MIDPAGGDAERRFLMAGDGVRLHCLHWRSRPSPPSAVLIFLHGIASHAGWFAETAADLNRQGVEVYGPDRRGSGRSGGPRGHLDRYEQALNDVERVVRLAAAEHPDTPVFLAASSWAAKLAVVYAARRPAPLSGLLLLGPGLTAEVKLSPARQVQVVVGHLVRPMAYLPIPLTPELYTANPPYLDFIRTDQQRRLKATTQFFWETVRLDRQRRRASAGLTLPLLLLQGEADKMIDVPQDAALVRTAGGREQDLPGLCGRRPYPGLRARPRPVPGRPAGVAGNADRLAAVSAQGWRSVMATVTECDLFAVDLPFKVAFRHAAAARTSSESLFLRVRLDNGIAGWGEALPRAYVSGEDREQAFALLRDTILPALVGRSFGSLPEAVSFLEKCDGKAPPEWVHPDIPQTASGSIRPGSRNGHGSHRNDRAGRGEWSHPSPPGARRTNEPTSDQGRPATQRDLAKATLVAWLPGGCSVGRPVPGLVGGGGTLPISVGRSRYGHHASRVLTHAASLRVGTGPTIQEPEPGTGRWGAGQQPEAGGTPTLGKRRGYHS